MKKPISLTTKQMEKLKELDSLVKNNTSSSSKKAQNLTLAYVR